MNTRLLLALCVLSFSSLQAAERLMPQPLSLQQALDLALAYPGIQAADAKLSKAKAEALQIDAENDLNIDFEGQLRYVDPAPITPDRSNDDSKVFLRFSSELYDFGYTAARQQAADKQISSAEKALLSARQQHLLKVAELFFNVLIADKEYVLIDEVMTAAFLDYDKLRERHELGTVSDVRLLELENDYREKLQLRKQAEQKQRMTRMLLASAMAMPEQLPADLIEPPVDWQKDLPDLAKISAALNTDNPQVLAASEAVEAARAKLSAAESNDNPRLSANLQWADYQRETGSTHPFEAGLVLNVPLYSGARQQADQQLARADLQEKEMALQLVKMQAQEAALQNILSLESYKSELDSLKVSADYAELYLDKNRALYELEVASSLKDALIKVSDVILKKIRARLGYKLAEMKLAALQGQWQFDNNTVVSTTENQNEKDN